MTLLAVSKKFERILSQAAQQEQSPQTVRPGFRFESAESLVPGTEGIVPETAKRPPPSASIRPEWLVEPPSDEPEAVRNPGVNVAKIYQAGMKASGLQDWLLDYLTHRATGHKKFIDLISSPERPIIWAERDEYKPLADAYDAAQASIGSRLRAIRERGAPLSRPLPAYREEESSETLHSVRNPERTLKTGVDALDSALELMQLAIAWLDDDNKPKAKKNILQAISIIHFWAKEFVES